jgi:C_GCAxxG_C_C family probable redox protein
MFKPQLSQGAEDKPKMFVGLTRDSTFDIGEQGKAIIDRAYQLGHDYQAKQGGCCRCTVAALQQAIGFIPEDKGLFRTASCLDGGATSGGIQNCGAFTGAGMVIGWICAVEGFGDTSLSHQLIRKVSEKFTKDYGSVLCQDVRKGVQKNCSDAVGKASQWTAEILLSQFTNYNPQQ